MSTPRRHQFRRYRSDDISTDPVLRYCDYLALIESWMRDMILEEEISFSVGNYECVSRSNNCTGRSTRHAAGDVAIYRQISSPSAWYRVLFDNCISFVREFGDMSLAELTRYMESQQICLGIGLHPPGYCATRHANLPSQAMVPYIPSDQTHPFLRVNRNGISIYMETSSIKLYGDLNVDILRDVDFVACMEEVYNLDCATRPLSVIRAST